MATAAEQFRRDGFLHVRQLADTDTWQGIRELALNWLEPPQAPLEFESDLAYPGAPRQRQEPGGATPRRLLQAWQRHTILQKWVRHPELVEHLRGVLGTPVWMPLAHHNCIMTKHPAYSSDSGWHQDLRYWSYQEGNLVTAWLALGPEREENGCLRVIAGSHQHAFPDRAFDEERFFRDDLAENQPWLKRAIPVEMEAGDVLLFHSRLLHAASRNRTEATKLAAVFTYRHGTDSPLAGSRSARGGDVLIAR